MNWLRDHDPGFAALRRAGRAALLMPAMFAFGDKVIGNPAMATAAAAISMTVVAFAVLFAGVVSSALASATTSLLLAFILPVSIKAPPSQIPDRLAGWGLAALASLFAISLLWPAPTRNPLRDAAV